MHPVAGFFLGSGFDQHMSASCGFNQRRRTFPGDVIERARSPILERLGALRGRIASANRTNCRESVEHLARLWGKVPSSVLEENFPRFAAFVNGVSPSATIAKDTQLSVSKDRV